MSYIKIWRSIARLSLKSLRRIDKELQVKLFYKRNPIPLATWFGHVRSCKLDRKCILTISNQKALLTLR